MTTNNPLPTFAPGVEDDVQVMRVFVAAKYIVRGIMLVLPTKPRLHVQRIAPDDSVAGGHHANGQLCAAARWRAGRCDDSAPFGGLEFVDDGDLDERVLRLFRLLACDQPSTSLHTQLVTRRKVMFFTNLDSYTCNNLVSYYQTFHGGWLLAF